MRSFADRPPALSLTTALLAAALCATGCAAEVSSSNETAAEEGKCASVVFDLTIGGWATALIDRPDVQEKLGRTAEQCSYNFPLGAWEDFVGDCAVTGITFQGSEPIPHLFSLSKNFEKLVDEDDVETGGELAWFWKGDVFNCDETGCATDGLTQIELLRADLNLSSDMDTALDNCPWTQVQARFELKEVR